MAQSASPSPAKPTRSELTADAPTFQDVERAAELIAADIVRTPTLHSRTLSSLTGADVFLKFENLQFTGAFKDRGAANHLRSLDPETMAQGVVALSAGNHAQGVAYMAGRLGITAAIVMPTSAPFSKVSNTEALGASVVQEGQTLAETVQTMERLRNDFGYHFVPPYDDPKIIAGQGTTALEMLLDAPDLETLLVPVGGGGLLAGMALAARHLRPEIELIGVQVDAYPMAAAAFHQRSIEPTGATTIADGIAVKGVGSWTMPIISRLVDDMIVVSEASTEHSIALLAEIEKTIVEGAGAVGLAALLENKDRFAGRKVGIVLSGGNIDLRLLSSILLRGLARSERVSALRVEVTDLPGALAPVVNAIAGAGASIVDITHRRTFETASARAVSIEVIIETRDLAHREKVVNQLKSMGHAVTYLS